MGIEDKFLDVDGKKDIAQKNILKAKLDDVDQQLIKHLLIYGDRNPDRWGTSLGLAEKVLPENKDAQAEIKKRLKALPKKLEQFGVRMHSRESHTLGGETVFAIERKDVDRTDLAYMPTLHPQKEDTSILLIADPGFGQIYHHPLSDKGAHYFLKENNYLGKLDAALIMGAVPHIPDRRSEISDQYLLALGKKAPNTQFKDEKVESEDLSAKEKEFRRKHVENKITTVPEAVESAAYSLETILGKPGKEFKGEVHLSFSYQDQKNLTVIKRKHASDLSELKDQAAKHEQSIKRLEQKYDPLKKEYAAAESSVEFLKGLGKGKAPFEKRLAEYVRKNKETLEHIKQDSPKQFTELQKTLESVKEETALTRYLESKISEKVASEKKMRTLENEIEAENTLGASVKRTMSNFNVYKFLGHMPSDAKKINIHHSQAMEEYNKTLAQMWGGWDGSTKNLHPDRVDIEIKGHTLRVEPKMNRSSNSIGKATFELQKSMLFKDLTDGAPLPDVYVSGHDDGGYRAYPTPVKRESMREDAFQDAPRTMLQLKLPTMQYGDILKQCHMNNIDRLPDVVRKMKGNFGSGIVVLNISKDGQYAPEFVSTDVLMRLGLNAEEYESIQKQLEDKKLSKQERSELETRASELKESFKITPQMQGKKQDLIDIALMPESHIGAQNPLGRTFNSEHLKAVVEYERNERKPAVVMYGGDNVHGDHNAKGMRTAAIDMGLLPHEIDKTISLIRADRSLSSDQKISILARFAYLNRQTQPITSSSKQLEEYADCGATELGENAIDRGGLAIAVSGNHYNKSNNMTHDESMMNRLGFDRRYRKGGHIHIADGVGEGDGRNEISLNQLRTPELLAAGADMGTLYTGHSFRSGKDTLGGMMTSVQKMGLEAHTVVGFHLHCAGAGYADGKNFFMGPGGQAMTKFVEQIGQMGGFRGAMNVELSRNPVLLNGYQKTTFVDLQYLQKNYLKEETWAQKMLVEKYIPLARGRNPVKDI